MAPYGPTPLPILPLLNPLLSANKRSIISSQTRRKLRHPFTLIITCGLIVHLILFWREAEFRASLAQTGSLWPKKGTVHDLPVATSIGAASDSTVSGSGTDLAEPAEAEAVSIVRRPLTGLGLRADDSYKLGSTVPLTYRNDLSSFIRTSFPPSLQPQLQAGFDLYFPLGNAGNPGPVDRHLPAMINHTNVWQTNKDHSVDFGGWRWRNREWKWNMLNDADAVKWVREKFGGSDIEKLWDDLPTAILKVDFLRYLLVFFNGGVYSDTDTLCLHPIEEWGASADLWSDPDGKSWLPPMHEGESPEAALGPPSVVIGVEVDVGDREDWYRWWPRPLQVVQWTIAAAPHHPIFVDVISRVASSTARAKAWSEDRDKRVVALRQVGKVDEANALARVPLHDNGDNGGYMPVMEWTGPGVFTDAVFRYLEARYNVTWPALRMLERPLRVGDVVILPITGFSPGMNGANLASDPQAMIRHLFLGSWKGPS
ncbi:membrane-bound alpha-1,6- mannosyltransferase Initiation-specific [Tulasnella sp. JGI-2019a]|nr:membrane-bound alpha-1,6- mannosyltransferase Initiation-specific [Tulasnella sp. JGI-2019a]